MARKTARSPRSKRTVAARAVPGRVSSGSGATDASPFALQDRAVESALLTGEHSGLLEDYFGPARYAELRRLARQAASNSVRGGERVLILPGIMGSKLGYTTERIFDDVLWIDFGDVATGRLEKLALVEGGIDVKPLGVILLAYLALKLRLRIAGFDVDFHPYDWRRSLADLGAELAQRLADETGAGPVHLVAHSMGGLVARAALVGQPARLGRVVMLGSPNHGSFSLVQAFRGVHSIVRKLDFLDPFHSAAELAREVFATFPGLYELIPQRGVFGTDFFNLSSWPGGGVRPDAAVLSRAREVVDRLPADFTTPSELVIIAGVERETIVDARIEGDEFVYTTSWEGDGTVPLRSARLDGAACTYYVAENHGLLPNNRRVAEALLQILPSGRTDVLPSYYRPRRERTGRRLGERTMSTAPYEGNRGRALSLREQRSIMEEFGAPDRSPAVDAEIENMPVELSAGRGVVAETGGLDFSRQIVIGRRRHRRLDVTLALGSITEVNASAYALGLFRNVQPSGAASALDEVLDGAIAEMVARRMFNGNVSEVSVLPTGRHPVRADAIAFAGLGAIDRFTVESLAVIGENLIRTFVATRVDDFAIVPPGGATGAFEYDALQSLFSGFIRGLAESDGDHRFHGITICEIDHARFVELRNWLYRLAASPLFDDVEVILRECVLPPPAPVARRGRVATGPESVYLLVREESVADATANVAQADTLMLTASVLTAGAKATIYQGQTEINRSTLDQLLAKVETPKFDHDSLPAFGKDLAALVLPESVRKILARYADNPLVVVHDAAASRIPWETISIGDWAPALAGGISHLYEAENLSVAKWLHQRQKDPVLDVLLVVNPTNDLTGAAEEGERVRQCLTALGSTVRIVELVGGQAQKAEVMRHFSSGHFDVVHYAGHAFFDPSNPARSGILCASHQVLSGADLASIGNLPSLVFFNACEAARVRGDPTKRDPNLAVASRVQRNVGFAEAFLRGGVANFLGTYWPVGDAAALEFARVFYAHLLDGRSLAHALLYGRHAIKKLSSVDWADYVLYGDPDFVLKWRRSGAPDADSPQPAGLGVKRDMSVPTFVVCHGPPGTPPNTPVDVDNGVSRLETCVLGLLDVATHDFRVAHGGKTYAKRAYCGPSSYYDPLDILIDEEVP